MFKKIGLTIVCLLLLAALTLLGFLLVRVEQTLSKNTPLHKNAIVITLTPKPAQIGTLPAPPASTTPTPLPAATPTVVPTLTLEQTLTQVKKAVTPICVTVITDKGSQLTDCGTAVIVHYDPFVIVTAFHVGHANKAQAPSTINRITLPLLDFDQSNFASGYYADPQIDLQAFLFAKKPAPEFQAISINTQPLKAGQVVRAVGYPNFAQGLFEIGTGKVIAPVKNKGGITRQLLTSTATGPGSSGGALINQSGELVGITVATARFNPKQTEGYRELTIVTQSRFVQALLDVLLTSYLPNSNYPD